jgi:rubrerythrin
MARKEKNEPRSVRMLGDLTNRTGLLVSPLADEMRENIEFQPLGTIEEFRQFRGALLREGGVVGTIPRPASLKGAAKQAFGALKGERPLVLLDKLGERLAFERTGTRLYETLLAKHDRDGGFANGPTAAQLSEIRAEELEHFHTLVSVVERLGGDPTAVTPSADAAAVASMGVIKLAADPRVPFADSLQSLLIAELVDVDGWTILRGLAEEADDDELRMFTERAEQEEMQHLARVRSWIKLRTLGDGDGQMRDD